MDIIAITHKTNKKKLIDKQMTLYSKEAKLYDKDCNFGT